MNDTGPHDAKPIDNVAVPHDSASPLVDAAFDVLSRDPHLRYNARFLQIEDRQGTLVLHGRLPSFYLVQVLQTVLGRLDGVKSIENRINVLWPPAKSDNGDSAARRSK